MGVDCRESGTPQAGIRGLDGALIRGRRGVRGSLQVLLLLAVTLVTVSGFGIWGYFRDWRTKMTTQLRLDRCVGKAAQNLRDSLNSILSDNQRIQELRSAIKLAKVEPWLIPPLEAALTLVVAKQELTRFRWKAKQAQWLVSRGCGSAKDSALPLPSLQFVRLPPDIEGLRELVWPGGMPRDFFFQAQHPPRYAAARVEGGSAGTFYSFKKWIAIWSAPKKWGGGGVYPH